MIARSFRPVVWVFMIGTAVLGCYLLNLRVAAERAELAKLDRQIIAAQRSIRALQTEVGTRSRIPQLQEWNNEVLALSAPVTLALRTLPRTPKRWLLAVLHSRVARVLSFPPLTLTRCCACGT